MSTMEFQEVTKHSSTIDEQPSAPTSRLSLERQIAPITAPAHEEEYVQGFQLGLILISTTIVYFLMMLDMSILATVGHSGLH